MSKYFEIKICPATIACFIALLLFASSLYPQQSNGQLSPSEALKYSLEPFDQARMQDDDLTDADLVALRLGISRASQNCNSLIYTLKAFANDPAQQLAMAKLCLWGRQYENARVALVGYLSLPNPSKRETALLLLVKAFLGLNNLPSARLQVLSLLRDYPYDADIHLVIDEVIGAAEGLNSDVNSEQNQLVMDLCKRQVSATLRLLDTNQALQGSEQDVPVSRVYMDALHCAVLERSLGSSDANDLIAELSTLPQKPSLQVSVDMIEMKEALARTEMLGRPVPYSVLHAQELLADTSYLRRTISLEHSTLILAIFTLWTPEATDMIQKLAILAQPYKVYAVTSWAANTGTLDTPSADLVRSIHKWRHNLPRGVSLLLVPDQELRALRVSQYPTAITVYKGVLLFNGVLMDDGAVRLATGQLKHVSKSPRQ